MKVWIIWWLYEWKLEATQYIYYIYASHVFWHITIFYVRLSRKSVITKSTFLNIFIICVLMLKLFKIYIFNIIVVIRVKGILKKLPGNFQETLKIFFFQSYTTYFSSIGDYMSRKRVIKCYVFECGCIFNGKLGFYVIFVIWHLFYNN